MKFDTIIPAIVAGGTADVGVSGFTITPQREEEVDFSTPICDTNQCIVVLNGSDITDESRWQASASVPKPAPLASDWAKENLTYAQEIVAFDEYPAVFAALQSGQVAAVVLDKPVADYYIKVAYSDCQVVKEIPTGEQYGIAISKDNPNLTAAIDDAIAQLEADGTDRRAEPEMVRHLTPAHPSPCSCRITYKRAAAGVHGAHGSYRAPHGRNAPAREPCPKPSERQIVMGTCSKPPPPTDRRRPEASLAAALVALATVLVGTTLFRGRTHARQALDVESCTASPNEDGGDRILGDTPTRVTWRAHADEARAFSKVTLAFPEGAECQADKVKVTGLSGLDRVELNAQSPRRATEPSSSRCPKPHLRAFLSS